ncbi:hypothetical protein EW145_g3485 [Phellinidium pouzarii]|uniref:Uncharacterized protein n=1 Tax=Phellinidium pouzarii TaxID=167371 RepID=A0A4S4L790_9AGAM|nr:hypothetical protein EW145_g3485 [Phellinidium pouzarii]
MLTELTKELRNVLIATSDDKTRHELFDLLDSYILDISSSDADDISQKQPDFDEELQVVFNEDVDYSNLQQSEIFLEVLLHARPILPPTSFITTWFDLLLRPALREPRLAPSAVEHAKQLVLDSLEITGDGQGIVANFRRRLLDLFLLDVLNESSGKDILEWAQLDEGQKERNSWWKTNLEDILVRHGLLRPEELLDVMDECFVSPSSRLQILTLLDLLVTQPSFIDISSILLTHPFMSSFFRSLEVDNSSTVCAVELSLLVKILPSSAIKSYEHLGDALPRLLGILGRVLCWKSRSGYSTQIGKVSYSDLLDYDDKDLVSAMEKKELEDEIEDFKGNWQAKLRIREDLSWKRLERTFDLSTSSLPVPRPFFAFLYYIFPCNVIHFLRKPSFYLRGKEVESPWTVGWEDALDDLQVRTAGTSLLRSYAFHPSVVWHDVTTELADLNRWLSYDVSQIVGECMMLDSHMANQTSDRHDSRQSSSNTPTSGGRGLGRSGDITMTQTPTTRVAQLDSVPVRQRKISLRELIATSAALKSGAEINISDKAPVWPSILFTPPPSTAPSRVASVDLTMVTSSSPTGDDRAPAQIGETIAGLQREVLLLRTELNFELWLKRENISHISRLHKDGVITKSAELQQQRQQNRLREYRSQLSELQKELKSHQDQAHQMKQKHVEWNEELSSKLSELREQKKTWMAKENALRSDNVDLKAHLVAQSKLLDAAYNNVFQLETEIKADALKVQRLRDYEKRIEQLTEMHRMWYISAHLLNQMVISLPTRITSSRNKDIMLYNEQSKEMSELISEHQKMKMRVEDYGKAQEDAEVAARESRQRIQTLEASLRVAQRVAQQPRPNVMQMLTLQSAERDALAKSNTALREENEELRNELDELRAMVEVLRAQQTGTKGLVHLEQLISLHS